MAEPYYIAMDSYPQEEKKFNKLYKFFEHFREGRFATTKCKECGRVAWPPRTICPDCVSDNLEWVNIGNIGKIYVYTAMVGGVPMGYKAPLVFALVDFPVGLRVLTPLVETAPGEVKVGADVELVVQQISRDRVLLGFRLRGC